MAATTDETVADRLEATIREMMAKLTTARGWDTARAQEDERAYLDALLDEFNALGR